MRNDSHKTLIGTIKTAVVEWRKREGWSRETVVQEIVDAHERLEGPVITDIRFEPTTRDAFQRQKVNADRVFRWLDDEGKDTNLLPANFIPSILAALPVDLQLQCVGEILRPLGLDVCTTDDHDSLAFDPLVHASSIIKEGAEAAQALLKVGPGSDPAAIESARKELADLGQSVLEAGRALPGGSMKVEK